MGWPWSGLLGTTGYLQPWISPPEIYKTEYFHSVVNWRKAWPLFFCWRQRGGVWQSTFYNVKLRRCWRSEIFPLLLLKIDQYWDCWPVLQLVCLLLQTRLWQMSKYSSHRPDWSCLTICLKQQTRIRTDWSRWPYRGIIVWKVINYSCEMVNACSWSGEL